MRSDWLPGTSDLSGMGRHGCVVESRSPAEGDVRCAGRRVGLKRTGRRASGGRGILLREAAPPLRAGGPAGTRRTAPEPATPTTGARHPLLSEQRGVPPAARLAIATTSRNCESHQRVATILFRDRLSWRVGTCLLYT